MPYKLIGRFSDGRIEEIKPLAPDNPHYGFDDHTIYRKASILASRLNDSDAKFSVKPYESSPDS